MNIQDLLLDHAGWSGLNYSGTGLGCCRLASQSGWSSGFGDLFIRLDDGSILISTQALAASSVAATRGRVLRSLRRPRSSQLLSLDSFVDELVGAGRTLSPGECYSYQLAQHSRARSRPTTSLCAHREHYNIFGPQHHLTKGHSRWHTIDYNDRKRLTMALRTRREHRGGKRCVRAPGR
jgi:hypothetical protein